MQLSNTNQFTLYISFKLKFFQKFSLFNQTKQTFQVLLHFFSPLFGKQVNPMQAKSWIQCGGQKIQIISIRVVLMALVIQYPAKKSSMKNKKYIELGLFIKGSECISSSLVSCHSILRNQPTSQIDIVCNMEMCIKHLSMTLVKDKKELV